MQREALFEHTSSWLNDRMFSRRPATHWKALRSGTFRDGPVSSDLPVERFGPQDDGRHPVGSTRLAEMVASLLAAAEAKDSGSRQHACRVAARARELGLRRGLSEGEMSVLGTAALLHDIGKIGMPDAILAKPGPLTRAEYATIQRHPAIGESILRPFAEFDQVRSLVRHHHEWYDGRGYPDGLAGERIPLGARILQVADSIDAMLTPRSYKSGCTEEEIVAELTRCRGTQFDPAIADLAVASLTRG
ncbi:MAG TPA: HD-GYP domain-containing protein [Phycisphaerae bacterium]|nr:HD-GYP domain-containing protein [Phycisphaerae bacterium]